MRAAVAEDAFSLWQEKPGSSWSCQGAASPSCSHWANLPRNYCLRDASGGNSLLQCCVENFSARARLNNSITGPGECFCVRVVFQLYFLSLLWEKSQRHICEIHTVSLR